MTQQQLLLRLKDLDEQTARYETQRQRNGLSAYEERLARVSEELSVKTERIGLIESDSTETELAEIEKAIARLEGLLSRSTSYDTALLKNELAPLREQKAALEDRALHQMLELEELQPQLPGLRASLLEVQQELEEARPEEQERLDNLTMRLEALARERGEVTALLPQEVVNVYAKTGRVDEIKQGRCRCRLEVPDHFQRQIRAGNAWVCNTCGSLIIQNLNP